MRDVFFCDHQNEDKDHFTLINTVLLLTPKLDHEFLLYFSDYHDSADYSIAGHLAAYNYLAR